MLYTVKQLRQIEQAAQAKLASGTLMRAAGEAAAQLALQLLNSAPQRILVVAGPGNNGGDAFETAAHLANAKHHVGVLPIQSKTPRSDEAQQALDKAQALQSIHWLDAESAVTDDYDLVIDGLFGIGLKPSKISRSLEQQCEQINALSCPVLALDIPSGLDADTGNTIIPCAIRATHTITFIGDKIGLHTADGKDYAGQIVVADLGIERGQFPASDLQLNRTALFPIISQARRQNSHKGSHGTVSLIGGTTGMQGALVLAARAALYAGAGKTIAGFIDNPPHYDLQQPEIMCHPAQQIIFGPENAVVIGPGLGSSVASFEIVSRALLATSPLVIDADALNLLSQQPALHALCSGRDKLSTILTPHPLEAARLLGCGIEVVQANRVQAAKKIARRFAAVVVLKGSGTVIAHPDGAVVINPTGNPGLASGGTGDVLAGVCGALFAQHKDCWQSALAATYLHGAAADNLVKRGIGPVGLTASELLVEIRQQLNSQ